MAPAEVPWSMLRSWAAYGAGPVVGLITAPLLARALGPEGRGQLAAILQPLTVADAVAAIGVPAAVTYFTAKGVPRAYVRTRALAMLVVSTGVVFVGLCQYSDIVSASMEIDRWLLSTIWTGVGLGVVLAYRRALWQGWWRFGVLDLERAGAAVARLGAVGGLFLAGVTSAVAYAGASIVAGLVVGGAVLGQRSRPREVASGEELRASFVRFALLGSVSTISVALNNRLDQAILPAAIGPSELGYYSVAVTFAEVPLIFSAVLVRNLLAERSANASKTRIRRTIAVGVGAVTLVSAVLAASASLLVPSFFGPAFGEAVPVTRILLLGTVIATLGSCASVYLIGSGHAGLGSLGPATSAVTTVIAISAMWDILSPAVAAWVSVASHLAGLTVGLGVLACVVGRKRVALR